MAFKLETYLFVSYAASFPCLYEFFVQWSPKTEKTTIVTATISGLYFGEIIGFGLSGVMCDSTLNLYGFQLGSWY